MNVFKAIDGTFKMWDPAIELFMIRNSVNDPKLRTRLQNVRHVSRPFRPPSLCPSQMLSTKAKLAAALNLTTQMTAGSGLHPVRNFDDVIKGDYKVIVMEATGQFEELMNAIPGTPKHRVYHDQIKCNPKGIVKGPSEAIKMMNEDGRTLFFYTLTARFITDELRFISTRGSKIQDQL